jgi:hypothetical protein
MNREIRDSMICYWGVCVGVGEGMMTTGGKPVTMG